METRRGKGAALVRKRGRAGDNNRCSSPGLFSLWDRYGVDAGVQTGKPEGGAALGARSKWWVVAWTSWV